jgi:ABC-type sugar transport system permease subunit/ABC-type glycerol-3-phosphate transport system substrate-binding protein
MKWILGAILAVFLFWFTSRALDPQTTHDKRTNLKVWGLVLGADDKGFAAQIKEFEHRNPDIRVTILSMGAGGMNPQKLMTAIVGKSPPDLIYQDRFTIGDWASRGTFLPFDNLIARDRHEKMCPRPEEYYPATWKEAEYRGKVYAIPAGADCRALFWNKKMFRDAAPRLQAMGLDPNRAPRTWSELKKYSLALTQRAPGGGLKTVGFLPNFGNSWLYLYSWEMNGEFMSPDSKTCTLDNPRTQVALQYMVDMYDAVGGVEQADSFASGFQGDQLDPFYTGKLAMTVDGNWKLLNIAQYAPNLEFGVAPPPVPDDRYYHRGIFADEKQTYVTWMGGFSWAIPVGSHHGDAAWRFIKWMTNPESALVEARAQGDYLASLGRIFVPNFRANRLSTEAVYAACKPDLPDLAEGMRACINLMPTARYRPVTFVGQTLWDEHQRAYEQAVHHKMSPKQALAAGQAHVQGELDRMASRQALPKINPALILTAAGVAISMVLGSLVWLARRVVRLGRLRKGEAVSGFLFISPWLLGFLIFTAGPILVSLFLSFCDYDVLHPAKWVGLGNYVELATTDKDHFGKAAWNVAYLAGIGVPLNLITGLAIALLLNTGVRGMRMYRTAFYIPSIAPTIAAAVLWAWVLTGDPDKGLLNAALRTIWPGHLPGWLNSETWSKPALIVMGLWGAGSGMILWLAGLQGVPRQLYEAAKIDGAGAWQAFRQITLPQISPYVFFNLVMGTIGALQEFDRIYVMRPTDQQGIGPVDSLLVPVYYLFDNAFKYFRMGFASAIAWTLFAVVLSLTLLQLRLAPRWVHYEGGRAKD